MKQLIGFSFIFNFAPSVRVDTNRNTLKFAPQIFQETKISVI